MIKTNLIIAFCLILFGVFGQQAAPKNLDALRIDSKISIDGSLDEDAWKSAESATDFRIYEPTPGEPSSQRSDVKVLYDDKNVYIGAMLFDASGKNIMTELTPRDNDNPNADVFVFEVNPYHDGQNAFFFKVTASNVQIDYKINSGEVDYSWNAVWESEVTINNQGWVVEIRIPYSAIRIPKENEQVWGVNFWRQIRLTREISTWNFVDKKLGEYTSQEGSLTNLSNIKSPLRLAFYPYMSAYMDFDPGSKKPNYSYNIGGDLKYGINESFTLDMTLIPDFGQVKSDNEVLNLSPYEVKYDEHRQFFTEGTELFNKAGLFYSRRIGKTPPGSGSIAIEEGDEIIENPAEAPLINATKISGRTKSDLGLGFFNAMTANTFARVRKTDGSEYQIKTGPFTNYNILVVDQTFQKNSFVNLINTNVSEAGQGKTANVTGTDFRLMDKNNRFGLEGNLAMSMIRDTAGANFDFGKKADFLAGKLNGNFTWSYNFSMMTNNYNPNDMGYLAHNNQLGHTIEIQYAEFQPRWNLLEWHVNTEIAYAQLYEPRRYSSFDIYMGSIATFKNYLTVGINSTLSPSGSHDYYETRVADRFVRYPSNFDFGGWISSDYRKSLALDVRSGFYTSVEEQSGYYLTVAPRMRFSNKFFMVYSWSYSKNNADQGYVKLFTNDSILFSHRDIRTLTNRITGNYVFSNKAVLSFKLNHYWSRVDYSDYFLLQPNGSLRIFDDYTENEDFNFNIFSIDLEYSWNFAPGSYMNIVWKNKIAPVGTTNLDLNYFRNLRNTLQSDQANSLSIKLIYYLDYQYFRKG
ncbi:MAG: carbohydrate binding family 9 domain-containing protein [Bacteroidales bacterium]|nr:carbohydrate binding family 9 domain-containing protein [Bacteroidales bacterium]MCF8454958.1 carbohydrate binding family 9 domain-containing protein [Bacteroidales bacterium]